MASEVREIATRAGVSPALVLHHFRSKDGLRAEVRRRLEDRVERLGGERVGPTIRTRA